MSSVALWHHISRENTILFVMMRADFRKTRSIYWSGIELGVSGTWDQGLEAPKL